MRNADANANALARHFAAMAYNNAWANHRLLTACAHLTDDELAAPRTSFFPSIAATLNHLFVSDSYYVGALERAFAGEPVDGASRAILANRLPYPHGADLLAAQKEVDRRLVDLCVAATDDRIGTPVGLMRASGTVFYEPANRLLLHMFQHQTHHRGQAHAMLAGTRIAPPQLDDFFRREDADCRAQDFAELGFREETIWGA